MARKLPWERKARQPPSGSPRRPSTPADDSLARPLSRSPLRSPSRNRTASPAQNSRASAVARRSRSPSTSPPPRPPSESYMVDGMDHDDRFRMVEDEFLSVARTFTAHLHAAEYQRLKTRAKSMSAAAIRAIARPVTGAPTAAVRKRQEAAQRHENQQRGLRRALGAGGHSDDDTDDAPWAGSSLHNLMEDGPPRGKRVRLTGLASSPARASAPVSSQTLDEDETTDAADEDDDGLDLDVPPVPRTRQPQPQPQPAVSVRTAAAQRSVAFAPAAGDDTSDGASDDGLDGADLLRKIRERRHREKQQRQAQQERKRLELQLQKQQKLQAQQELQEQQELHEQRHVCRDAHRAREPDTAKRDNGKALDIIPSFL